MERMNSMNTIDDYSFTEIFGVLHFKDNIHVHDPPHSPISSSSSSLFPPSSPSSSSSSNSVSSADANTPVSDIDISKIVENGEAKQYRRSDSISSTKSLCTEGLGSESSDEVEDLLKNENPNNDWQSQEEIKTRCTRRDQYENHWGESKRSRRNIGEYPPPISCIGRNGKPWVCFKSFRQDGRFILKEIRIPTQEFLHACRENGRLKLQLIQSDDEISDDDDDDDENDEDDDERSLDRYGEGEGEKGEDNSEEISSCNVCPE